ncbi:hypothetical protein K456DRAFT_1486578 [Colletotrichum gloeosporioides 23]|nr:hypothetical protein K456DRAFT_1486578 [Colletotrichum gloeosporioides 23]
MLPVSWVVDPAGRESDEVSPPVLSADWTLTRSLTLDKDQKSPGLSKHASPCFVQQRINYLISKSARRVASSPHRELFSTRSKPWRPLATSTEQLLGSPPNRTRREKIPSISRSCAIPGKSSWPACRLATLEACNLHAHASVCDSAAASVADHSMSNLRYRRHCGSSIIYFSPPPARQLSIDSRAMSCRRQPTCCASPGDKMNPRLR